MSKVGRLALRHEGAMWNAYYALEGTMKGAVHLGSIAINTVVDNPDRKRAFMDLMQGIVADFLQEKTGERPTWNEPQAAPEIERSGHS